jgi:hypothetical protein
MMAKARTEELFPLATPASDQPGKFWKKQLVAPRTAMNIAQLTQFIRRAAAGCEADGGSPTLGRALRSPLRVVLLPLQGALAALAPCRTPRPGSLERLLPPRVTFRTNTKQDADGAPARLPLGMGQADREGVRGRSADLPSLWIRDEAHSGHHQSFRSGYDPAPPHQDW